jgi:DNA-binding MurR/RpiR family transcriptional regulator
MHSLKSDQLVKPSSNGVLERLRDMIDGMTPANRVIARHILNNITDLPFETADSLAQKLGVSPVTIGRFCRAVGYPRLRELTRALRDDQDDRPWLVGPAFDQFLNASTDAGRFEAEVQALSQAYTQQGSNVWQGITAALAHAPNVWIAGFQIERGLANMLGYDLQYLRSGVHMVDTAAGTFADALLSQNPDDYIVIIDFHRSSNHALELAQQCRILGRKLIILTDSKCSWARNFTDLVLTIDLYCGGFWTSNGPFSSMIGLLLNDVVRHLGISVQERLNAISALYSSFVGYVEDKDG